MLIENVIQAGDIAGKTEPSVISVRPGDLVRDAVHILADRKIGLVIVCEEDGALAGVLSERDVIRALDSAGADVLGRPVSDFMSVDVQTCGPRDDPYAVVAAMDKGRFRHMPVVEDGKVIGVVSSKDIFAHMADVLSATECKAIWKRTLWV